MAAIKPGVGITPVQTYSVTILNEFDHDRLQEIFIRRLQELIEGLLKTDWEHIPVLHDQVQVNDIVYTLDKHESRDQFFLVTNRSNAHQAMGKKITWEPFSMGEVEALPKYLYVICKKTFQ